MPLAVLSEGLVDSVVLGEIDEDVGAVWQCALSSQSEALCEQIVHFQPTRENVLSALSSEPKSQLDRAFQTILKNRTFRGGILAPGASLMNAGENGRGVASRWYPQTLMKRLRVLACLSPLIEFYQMDAFKLIQRFLGREDTFFFIDPPYTAGAGKRAGSRLYQHHRLNHQALFDLLAEARGMVLMTYDDCPEVTEMANRHGFLIERIPMKNTHHEMKFELLISNTVPTAQNLSVTN